MCRRPVGMTYTCCSTDRVRADGAAEPGAARTLFTAIASPTSPSATATALTARLYPGCLLTTPSDYGPAPSLRSDRSDPQAFSARRRRQSRSAFGIMTPSASRGSAGSR